jgi:hypothetical protein
MTDEFRNDDAPDDEELTTEDLARAGEHRVIRIPTEPPVTTNQARAEYQSDARFDVRPLDTNLENPPEPVRVVTATGAAARAKMEEELGPLFPPDEANNLRSRWDSVQGRFVDEPRQAVEDADRLIAATMKRLAEIFADERQKLEHQWDRGDDVSTEDLRLGLRRYRSFFSRLLKV